MAAPQLQDVTQLLRAWSDGEQEALDRLIPLVYSRVAPAGSPLHGTRAERAHAAIHGSGPRSIRAAYQSQRCGVEEPRSFFRGFGAGNAPHPGGLCPIATLQQTRRRMAPSSPGTKLLLCFGTTGLDIVALDDALRALAGIDPRKGRVVEMRFFGGLSIKETAEVLNVSEETVQRDWRLAKVWLLRQLSRERAA